MERPHGYRITLLLRFFSPLRPSKVVPVARTGKAFAPKSEATQPAWSQDIESPFIVVSSVRSPLLDIFGSATYVILERNN
jgi:hypothetical protein